MNDCFTFEPHLDISMSLLVLDFNDYLAMLVPCAILQPLILPQQFLVYLYLFLFHFVLYVGTSLTRT
jgi:hypothetical protein